MNGKLESIQAMDALRISSPLWRTQCCVYVKHPVFHGWPQIFHSTGGPFPHVSGTTKRQSLTQFQAVPWLKFDHSWRSSLKQWLNPIVCPWHLQYSPINPMKSLCLMVFSCFAMNFPGVFHKKWCPGTPRACCLRRVQRDARSQWDAGLGMCGSWWDQSEISGGPQCQNRSDDIRCLSMIYDLWWFMMICEDLWWFMMSYDDLWWVIMIYDGLWWFMMSYDELWWFMMSYYDLWWVMMSYDDLWWVIMIYDELLWFLMIYDELWWVMMSYDDVWWVIMMFVDLWWFMMIYDELWWFMMSYDDLWWVMMIYDALWWVMMIYDDLWWVMMIYDELLWFMMIYDELWWIMMSYDDLWLPR